MSKAAKTFAKKWFFNPPKRLFIPFKGICSIDNRNSSVRQFKMTYLEKTLQTFFRRQIFFCFNSICDFYAPNCLKITPNERIKLKAPSHNNKPDKNSSQPEIRNRKLRASFSFSACC